MKITTTGQELFECCVDCVENGFSWNKVARITTDEVRALTGKIVGMIKRLKKQDKAEHSDTMPFHCIMHQESLCKAALDVKHIIYPLVTVVNILRARALNQQLFKSHLEKTEAKYTDIMYHNNIRWLSIGEVLQ